MEQISNRMPRPEGTTFLCREVYRAKSEKVRLERKNRLLHHLVNVYTMSGFRINGHSLNLAQFSNLLGVKQEKIQSILFDKAHTIQAFSNPDTLKETANSLASMCTTWAIQDRGLLQQHVEMLLRSQKGKYMPFITAEVTKALQTLMTSNKNVAEIFKTFYSQGGININMTQTNQKQENILTIDKAYEIVRESTPQIKQITDHKQAQILSPETLQQIKDNNNLPDPDLLRMYDHLDTSGWEKGRTLESHRPQTRKSTKVLLDTTEQIEEAVYSNTEEETDTGDSGFHTIQNIDNSISGSMSIGHGKDKDSQGLHGQVSDKGQDREGPAALEKGFLPGPSQPSSPQADSPSGISQAAMEPVYTASEDNQGSTTSGPTKVPKKKKKQEKPYTLLGSKLGSKVSEQTHKQDNLDRHLKAHNRRRTTEAFPSQIPDSPDA